MAKRRIPEVVKRKIPNVSADSTPVRGKSITIQNSEVPPPPVKNRKLVSAPIPTTRRAVTTVKESTAAKTIQRKNISSVPSVNRSKPAAMLNSSQESLPRRNVRTIEGGTIHRAFGLDKPEIDTSIITFKDV